MRILSAKSGHRGALRTRHPRWLAYGLPLATTAAVLLVLEGAGAGVPRNSPVIVFLFPVMLSAYTGGFVPGLISTALAALAVDYFVLPPIHTWRVADPMDVVKLLALTAAGTLMSFLMADRENSRDERAAREGRGLLASMERKVQAGFTVLLACMVAVAAVSYPAVVRVHDDEAWVAHTQQVIATLRLVLSTIGEAEAGERSYIITGHEEYLAPYNSARRDVGAALGELRRLTADNAAQQRHLDSLEPLVAGRMGILQCGVDARRQGFELAQAVVLSGAGERVDAQIDQIAAEMEAEEQILLTAREARTERATAITKVVIGGGSALAVLVVAAGLLVIGEAFKASRRDREALSKSHEELEQRVRERTVELRHANQRLEAELAERKQIEAALRESEERLRLAIAATNLGTWGYNPLDGAMIWDARCKEMFGLPPEAEGNYATVLAGIQEEDRERVNLAVQRAFDPDSGGTYEAEFRTVGLQDGGILRWIHGTGKVLSQKGQAVHLVGTSQDITERKRAETALRESEQRLRLAVQAARIGTFDWNVQSGLNVWSPELEAMYGLAHGEFGKTQPAWEQLVHPEDRAAAVGRVERAFETGEPVEGEWRVVWRDGSVHWILGCFQAVRDAAGAPLRLSGANIDITGRKQAEEELERRVAERTAQLAESTTRLETVTSNAPIILFATDAQGVFTIHRGKAIPATGRKPGELVGTHYQDLEPARNGAKEHFRRALAGEPSIETFENAAGNTFETHYSPLKDADGRVAGTIAVAVDITERKAAEEKLRQSEKDLKEAQRVGRIGNWSIDFGTGHVRWSEELYRIVGYPPSSPIPPFDEQRRFFTTESWAAINARIEQCRQDGIPYEIETETVSVNGRHEWQLARGEAVRDSKGSITGLRGIAMDITERKQAEEARSRLAAIVESSAVAIESINLDGVITSWNPGAERLYGFTAEEAIGQPISIIAPPELAGDVERTLEQLAQNIEVRHLDTVRLCKDGTRVNVAATISPVRDALGRIVGASSVSLDITERQRAEEALRSSEELLRSVIDCSTELIFVKDRELKTALCNKAFAGAIGKSVTEACGNTDAENGWDPELIKGNPEKGIKGWEEDDRRALSGETVHAAAEPGNVGTAIRLFETVKSPLRNARGQIVGLVGVSRDVTERKRAEEKLRKLNRALRTIGECDEALVHAQDEQALLDKICQILVQVGSYRLVWVGYAQQDEARSVRPMARAGADEGYIDNARLSWADNERGRGPTGRAIREAATFVARQTSTEPEYDPWRAAALEHGFASSVALPLSLSSHHMGALMLYSSQVDAFDQEEIKLLSELAGDLSYGIRALRTRAERQRAEANLTALIESTSDLIWSVDLDYKVLTFNRAVRDHIARLYGVEMAVGLGAPDLLDPARAALWQPLLDRALAEGPFHTEYTLLNGRAVDFSFNRIVEEGRTTGISIFGKDITERKRAEEALRESEGRLRLFLERAPVAIAMFDPEMRYLAASRRWLEDYRLGDQNIIGRSHYELFPELPDRWREIHKRCLAGSIEKCEDDLFLRADGTSDWLRWEMHPWRLHTGEVGGAIIFAEIITERKRAEEALQAERQRLYEVLETVPAMVCLLTPDYHVAFGNRAFRERFGESQGRHCYEYCWGRQAPCEFCESYQVLKTGQPHRWEVTAPDGSVIDAHDFPFTDVDGSPMILEMDIDITESRKAKEALEKASAYNRTLLEASLDPLVTIAPDGRITDVNAATETATGYSRQDLIGTDFSDYFTEPERARAGYLQVFKEGLVKDYELEVRHRDGHTTPVLYNSSLYRDEKGEVVGVFAAARDITERKRVQAIVAAERQRFNSILDVLPAYTVLLSPDYHVPFANRFFEERFGKSHGKRCFEYLFGRTSPCEVCHSFEPFETREPVQWYWTGPDGRDYDIHDFPFTDTDGSPMVLEMGIDITEQKRAQAALRESQAMITSIVDSTTDFIWSVDPERFGLLTFNKGMIDCFVRRGVKLQKGMRPEDVFTDDASLAARWRRIYERTLAEGHFHEDYESPTAGSMEVVSNLLRRDGVVFGISVFARDVTERRRAEAEIQDLNAGLERRVAERTAELAAVNQELEAFSYSVAHDLRAPLRAIDGFSLALVEDFGPQLDRGAHEDLGRVRRATQRMSQLIDDLLHLSRISRAEVRREKVDLSALAQSVISDLEKQAPERRLEFVSPSSLEVQGDPGLLRVALENLLGNAWKFSAQRSPSRIELGTLEQNGRQVYFVRDNGVGFDMAYVSKLFAPFQRLHSSTEFPGTGIGLVTVARIIRKHGGDIWTEGAVDKGATFYFTLKSTVDS